jgi:hypothetical protein
MIVSATKWSLVHVGAAACGEAPDAKGRCAARAAHGADPLLVACRLGRHHHLHHNALARRYK